MCKAIEDMRNESEKIGIKKGAYDDKIEIATELLADGTLSHEKISKVTKLPIEKIRELSESMSVTA